MWWNIFALLSSLFWAIGTIWAMINDLKSAKMQQKDLLETLDDIAREEAQTELRQGKFSKKFFGQWRDLLEIRNLSRATEAISDSEYKNILFYYNKVISWFILSCAGIAGLIASLRPFVE